MQQTDFLFMQGAFFKSPKMHNTGCKNESTKLAFLFCLYYYFVLLLYNFLLNAFHIQHNVNRQSSIIFDFNNKDKFNLLAVNDIGHLHSPDMALEPPRYH